MANHGITVCVTFLEFLSDDILAKLLILNLHYCIVQIRIKFLTNRFDWLYSCFLKYSLTNLDKLRQRYFGFIPFGALERSGKEWS